MRTIVYIGATSDGGDPLGLLSRKGARRGKDGAIRCPLDDGGDEAALLSVADPEAALRYLRERTVEAVILDTREQAFDRKEPGPTSSSDFRSSRVGRVLEELYPEGRLTTGVPRERVLGVVSGGSDGVQAAYNLGQYRVGHVLTDPPLEELLGAVAQVTHLESAGRIAVCLAGGGIEGLLYELGVLRALDWFLSDRSIVDVDLFCGISAGAVIGAFLANGVGPDEIARGFAGGSARIDPIRRGDLFDPNLRELPPRLGRLARDLLRVRRGPRGAFSSVARALPSALFAGDRLRAYLKTQLSRPGMSDRFDELRRPLFVGATDQDTSLPVVFGEEGYTHVPVHRAVRASSAMVPFYAPERIDGRYYIDGGFSRTTNMRVAVRQGATLAILIDPLVPVRADDSGYVHRRGGMFGTMQGLKALVNGRFDKAVKAIADMFPDVSFWLFRPEGDEMRILSGSPMKYFFRKEVEEIAFHSTVRKLRQWLPEISRDFGRHNVTFRDPEAPRSTDWPHARLEPGRLGVDP